MNLRLLTAAAAIALLSTAASAHADTITTYSLNNVQLALGGVNDGTLSGTFTYDLSTATLVSANITATAATVSPFTGSGFDFIYGTVNPAANSTYALAGFNNEFQLTSIADANTQLRLIFSSPLNGSGPDAISSGTSFETQTGEGNRLFATGSSATLGTAAAPEPSSIALLGTGLLTAGGLLRRRRAA